MGKMIGAQHRCLKNTSGHPKKKKKKKVGELGFHELEFWERFFSNNGIRL